MKDKTTRTMPIMHKICVKHRSIICLILGPGSPGPPGPWRAGRTGLIVLYSRDKYIYIAVNLFNSICPLSGSRAPVRAPTLGVCNDQTCQISPILHPFKLPRDKGIFGIILVLMMMPGVHIKSKRKPTRLAIITFATRKK